MRFPEPRFPEPRLPEAALTAEFRVKPDIATPIKIDPPAAETPFDPLEWNTKLQEGKITFAEFIEKLNELNISYQVYPCANNKNKANIKYEYDGFPYVFNVDKSVINGAAPKPDEPSVPTFKKEELAGLDDNAIKRYFTVNADGTYSLNEANVKADFPEKDYGKIDTPAKLKEAIAKKAEADKTNSVAGAGGAGNSPTKGDFNTVNELSNYLFGTLRSDADIKNLKFDKGFSYEQIAELVRNRHKEDFASITKDQLKQAFIGEYKKRAGSTSNTGGTSKPSVPTFKKEELAGLDDNAIKRYFTVNADGTYSLNEANVKADFPEKDYGKIDTPAKLKEAIAKKAEADKTNSVTGAGGTGSSAKGDFINYNDMVNYLFNNAGLRVDSDIKKLNFSKVSFETISTILKDKHKNDFASVTKAQLKAEFLEEYNKKVGGSNNTNGADGAGRTEEEPKTYPSGYKNWDECWASIAYEEIYETVSSIIGDNAVMHKYYDTAKDSLYNELKNGFETLTKAQIQDKLIAKVRELKKADDAKGAENTKYTNIKDAATEITKDINKYIGSDYSATIAALLGININSNINTNYSINADGTIKLTDSTIAQKAFDQIIKKIKDIYGDAVNKLGGETVLKQLVSAAWMQAANNSNDKYDFGSVPFGTFMNKVLDNMKAIIKNLSNHPENIELLKQKPANQVSGITSNLPHYKTPDMDNGEVVYLNSNGKIENTATQTKINETKAELKKRLKAAYPYLSQTKIDSMLDKAFDDALKFANSKGKGNHNVCGMTVRIRNNNDIVMSDLVDLALRYFDIELRSSGSFGESIVSDDNTKAYNDAKAKEEADAKAAQDKKDAEEKAKYENTKSAATEISKDINKYIGSDYSATIAASLGIKINSNLYTNYSVNTDGTIKLTDSTAQKAFDQIIKKIKEIYGDAVNKLGGEKVLKQLLSAAWMQAADNSDSKYDFGKVPFGTFMDKVLNNMKTIIKNLSSNPELLEFYTKTPASKNKDLTKNLTHYNTNDTYSDDETITYTNGGVDPLDQKDLNETKADLEAKIKKAYPHLNPNVVKTLVNDAFTDALKNLWLNQDSPTDWNPDSWNKKKHRINMDNLVDLALYYFDIALFNYINQHPGSAYQK